VTTHSYDPIATIETFFQGTLALYTNPSGRNLHLALDDDILIQSQRGAELRVFAQSILDALDKQEGNTAWARPAGDTRPVIGLGQEPSHPDSGNFVFSTDGRLYFGGAIYYRHGYAPRGAVKPEPKPEHTPEPTFKVGDTVKTPTSSVTITVVPTLDETALADIVTQIETAVAEASKPKPQPTAVQGDVKVGDTVRYVGTDTQRFIGKTGMITGIDEPGNSKYAWAITTGELEGAYTRNLIRI
jgi:hypothetical protein